MLCRSDCGIVAGLDDSVGANVALLTGVLFVPVVEALVPSVLSSEDFGAVGSVVCTTSTTASLLPPVVVPLSSLSVFLQAAKSEDGSKDKKQC